MSGLDPTTRACDTCGTEIVATGRAWAARYCSTACGYEMRRRRLGERTCAYCGRSFFPWRETSKTCSRECRNKYTAPIRGEAMRGTGTRSPYLVRDGRPEHRVLLEQALGRKLRPDEQVHHINGDKKDNRIENLQIVTCSEHVLLHALERSKFTVEDILAIRAIRDETFRREPWRKQMKRGIAPRLAAQYGVSVNTIHGIWNRHHWANLEDAA